MAVMELFAFVGMVAMLGMLLVHFGVVALPAALGGKKEEDASPYTDDDFEKPRRTSGGKTTTLKTRAGQKVVKKAPTRRRDAAATEDSEMDDRVNTTASEEEKPPTAAEKRAAAAAAAAAAAKAAAAAAAAEAAQAAAEAAAAAAEKPTKKGKKGPAAQRTPVVEAKPTPAAPSPQRAPEPAPAAPKKKGKAAAAVPAAAPAPPPAPEPTPEELKKAKEKAKRQAKKAKEAAEKAAAGGAANGSNGSASAAVAAAATTGAAEDDMEWETLPTKQQKMKAQKDKQAAAAEEAPAKKLTAMDMMSLYGVSLPKPLEEKPSALPVFVPKTTNGPASRPVSRAAPPAATATTVKPAWGKEASPERPQRRRNVKAEETGDETEEVGQTEDDFTADERTGDERESKKKIPEETLVIDVPENKRARCIGAKGATLQLIIAKSGVKRIDTNNDVFTIKGSAEAIEIAGRALREIVENGCCSLQYDDYGHATVEVPLTSCRELIGERGAVVRKIRDELKVEIDIPKEASPDQVDRKKVDMTVMVSISGEASGVEKAKQVVKDIVEFHYCELTHPGEAHDEIMVLHRLVSAIIGKGGQEIRHIQETFKVKVHMGERTEDDKCRTLIVGKTGAVKKAKQYIEKLLTVAANRKPRQDKTNLLTGVITVLMDKEGYIRADNDGHKYYFTADMLGEGKSWDDFSETVHEWEVEHGHAPVYFHRDLANAANAKSVVAVPVAEMSKYEPLTTAEIDAETWAAFLEEHPDLEDASEAKKKQAFYWKQHAEDMDDDDAEAEAKRRDEVYGEYEEKEEDLYKRRDAANAKAAALREEAERLHQSGDHDGCKEKQAQARTAREEAVKLKREAEAFDWEKNEAMHKYVMENEHEEREIDGTWLDLHGLSLDFAMFKAKEFLLSASSNSDITEVEVIYGAGHHSGAGGPVIKGKILSMIQEHPPTGVRPMTVEVQSPGSCKITFT